MITVPWSRLYNELSLNIDWDIGIEEYQTHVEVSDDRHISESSISRAESQGIVGLEARVAAPESGSAAFVESVGVRVWAGALKVAVELNA